MSNEPTASQPSITPPTHVTDALLVVDMQRDFLAGGALAVEDGEAVIPGINRLAGRFQHVILTQDWHPRGHISFASTHQKRPFTDTVEAPYGTQQLWPDHCVQGTKGADLSSELLVPHAELILRKGYHRNIDSYSAFMENDRTTPTGLAGYLRERGLTRLFFVGLAYDFCVGSSALAAVALGFKAIVVEDLSRAVNGRSGIDAMNEAFATSGVKRISSTELSTEAPPERLIP